MRPLPTDRAVRRVVRHRRHAVLVVLLTLLVHLPTAAAATDASDEITSTAVRDYFDTAVPRSLERFHVPGATVAVVHSDDRVFSAGYGLADVENEVPFDPATSLVRIASITKLFTWTAVMQQVEVGRLDLDTDVNRYLHGFQVPDTFAEPVTLRTLMTHTAGFEDRGIVIGARRARDMAPLGDELAAHLPARIRPPGTVSAYSNHGAALAGHIVAEVSGQPWDRYVTDHILAPLGMHHSTASEPVPAPLADDAARSYETDGDGYRREAFVFDRIPPDGAISATAEDMARFLLAHLRDGRGEHARILDADTARQMHAPAFSMHPAIDGWTLGFKERTLAGHRVLMHDGGWEQFVSGLILVPDADLGVFITYNGDGAAEALGDVLPAFLDEVLAPGDTDGSDTAAAADGVTATLPGFYQRTRTNRTTVEKVVTLLSATRARIGDDGTLTFAGRRWRPTGGTVYREVDGTERLAAVPDDHGAVVYLATDTTTYARVPAHETARGALLVLSGFVVPALTLLLALPMVVLLRRVRRRRRRRRTGPTPDGRAEVCAPDEPRRGTWPRARVLAWLACAVGLGFVVAFAFVLLGDTSEFLYGVPATFRALMLAPLVYVALVVATVAATLGAWRGGGVAARVHQTVVVVGLLVLVGFLAQWNLIGWRFG